ncbi:hypothetical protein IA539_03940 [Gordonia sp. zg691]|uniref:hypothetical protein n=1 Tax=Gordonia jinghuaiqii TaxID=2758710 RepID=UPI001662731D|nr:hypothetical protein [Gordonia jinghuaiqii]MBD0860360.1 hypothetical protein [Gordonia jinghuaiqii]
MIPTVAQQLFAVRNTIEKAVMPAIDTTDGFALEQAGLVLASLDWIMDVQASEYDYERREFAEHRETLSALADLDRSTLSADDSELLAATDEPPSDLAQLRNQVRKLKAAVALAYQRSSEAGGALATDARRVVAAAAARQTRRELAWCRMTGFPQGDQQPIAEVLRSQDSRSVVDA